MADIDLLRQIRTNILTNIQAVTAAGPRVTYSVKGRSVDWNTWLHNLLADLKDINAQINAMDPWMFVTKGRT